jgi:hypothetical protein
MTAIGHTIEGILGSAFTEYLLVVCVCALHACLLLWFTVRNSDPFTGRCEQHLALLLVVFPDKCLVVLEHLKTLGK